MLAEVSLRDPASWRADPSADGQDDPRVFNALITLYVSRLTPYEFSLLTPTYCLSVVALAEAEGVKYK